MQSSDLNELFWPSVLEIGHGFVCITFWVGYLVLTNEEMQNAAEGV